MAEKLQACRKTITQRSSEVEPIFYERLLFLKNLYGYDSLYIFQRLKIYYPDCRLSLRGIDNWSTSYSIYHFPHPRYLIGLSKIFHCTVDYLIGANNEFHPYVKVRKVG